MPYKTVKIRAPLFMTRKGMKVYHVFKHDDMDGGVIRQYAYTLDPYDGSDEDQDGVVTFDVRRLSTWKDPAHPPFIGITAADNTPENREAWERHHADRVEDKAIKAAIRAALDNGEIGTPTDEKVGRNKRRRTT